MCYYLYSIFLAHDTCAVYIAIMRLHAHVQISYIGRAIYYKGILKITAQSYENIVGYVKEPYQYIGTLQIFCSCCFNTQY